MAPPPTSAWYLLNNSKPPLQRYLYAPDAWYNCTDWLSIGQRGGMAEWTIVATDALFRQTYQQRVAGNRRMMIIQGHVNPRAML